MRLGGPFARRDGGVTVVTQKLGPGILRGDCFETRGLVAAGAHLCVRAQSASRAFGGGSTSRSDARWRVESDGFLQVVGEPLVAFDDASHAAVTDVSLATGARYLSLEIVTRLDAATRVALRTRIIDDSRLLAHDACDLTGQIDPSVACVGTLLFCGGGSTETTYERLGDVCDAVVAYPETRAGVGRPRNGGVFVRVTGPRSWCVQQSLLRCRTAILGELGCGAAAVSIRSS